jgi:hypothetical protein
VIGPGAQDLPNTLRYLNRGTEIKQHLVTINLPFTIIKYTVFFGLHAWAIVTFAHPSVRGAILKTLSVVFCFALVELDTPTALFSSRALGTYVAVWIYFTA